MADDWDNWQPAAPTAGDAAFKQRLALSRGGTPSSPLSIPGPSRAAPGSNGQAAAAGGSGARQALPDPPRFPEKNSRKRGPGGLSPQRGAPAFGAPAAPAMRQWGAPAGGAASTSSGPQQAHSDAPKNGPERSRRDEIADRVDRKLQDEKAQLDRHRDEDKQRRERSRDRGSSRRERSPSPDRRRSDRDRDSHSHTSKRPRRERSPEREHHSSRRSRRDDADDDRDADKSKEVSRRRDDPVEGDRHHAEDRDRQRERDRDRDRDGDRVRSSSRRERSRDRASSRRDRSSSRDRYKDSRHRSGKDDERKGRPTETNGQDRSQETNGTGRDKRTTVIIENLAEGVTVEDVETTFEEFGKIEWCRALEAQGSSSPSFEVTYASEASAASAIATMHGAVADGQRVRVVHAEKKPAPLLERLSRIDDALDRDHRRSGRAGASATPPRKEAAEELPVDLLAPYDSLLGRAGVDSLSTLRRLVRRGSIKDYIDELAREYPDEVLLKGFTAKWALRDRLEEWLDVKAPAPEWESRRA